jgi:glycosyltransferase involved in cell wall biosynthesis
METRRERNPELTIVIPAYNEAENIEKAVRVAQKVSKSYFSGYEIIVVDDASSDNTSDIVKQLGKKDPRIFVITHKENQGKAAALNTGFNAAKGKYLFYTDADNQYDINNIKGLKRLIEKADIVSGCRINKAISPFRKLASDVYNLIARVLFGIKAKDIECAFKIFRSEKLKLIEIESSNFMVETEILAKASRLGFNTIDFPVIHYPRTGGETSVSPLRDSLRTVKGLIYLKWILDWI